MIDLSLSTFHFAVKVCGNSWARDDADTRRGWLAGIVLGFSVTSLQSPAFSSSIQVYPGLLKTYAAGLTSLALFSVFFNVHGFLGGARSKKCL